MSIFFFHLFLKVEHDFSYQMEERGQIEFVIFQVAVNYK